MSWRPPLALRMALSTLVVTLAIIALIGGGAAWFSYQTETDRLASELVEIRENNLPVLAKAVWDLAEDRQALIMDAVLAHDHLLSAVIEHDGIQDYYGNVHADQQRHGELQTFSLQHDGQEVGTLTLQVDREAVVDEAIGHALTILAITAVPCLLAALAILLLFERQVARHLSGLADTVPTLGLTDDTSAIAYGRAAPSRGDGDELDRLLAAILAMHRNLNREAAQRVEAELALQRSEANYREIFSAIGDAAILHSADPAAVVMCNPAACQLYGYQEDELIGKSIADLSPDDEAYAPVMAERQIDRAMERGEAMFEWQALRKDGSRVWVEVLLRPCEIAGQPLVLAMVRDITERIEAAEQLRQMQKMDSIGQMTGGLAHDFNNMLGAINGGADMLMTMARPGSDMTTYIELIRKAGNQAADLTAKMMAFARKDTYQRAAVMASPLLDDAVTLVERSIDKSIRVQQVWSHPGDLVVIGDRGALQNVIVNLCLNARDSMPDGGELALRTQVRTLDSSACEASPFDLTPGVFLAIEVADTGCGMSSAVVERAFEPFFTTKPAGKGTGMGLAAVYGTVSGHGGSIVIDSEEGRGTTMTVLLPAGSGAEPGDHSEPELVSLGEGCLLLVDDEDTVRRVAQGMLGSLGYLVVSAASGSEAVSMFEGDPEAFDLVILDMIMPGMSGAETFRALREIRPEVPVLICSGYAQDDQIASLNGERRVGFARKPLGLNDLAEAVANALAGRDPSGTDIQPASGKHAPAATSKE